MAGVSDYAFRRLCVDHGADYTVTEMISAKALCYADKRTAELARILREEAPVAIQIFGSEPEILARAAGMLSSGDYPGCISDTLPAAIDINMGCPVKKIVSNGEGSALMRDETLVKEIVLAVVEASRVPVTVKMRAGFDSSSVNAVKIASICEEAGATAVCIHGRTRVQMYRPPVDLEIIKEVKEALKIPVIGNGEIFSPKDALAMKNYTGCDSLMIARGSLGNPFIFEQIKDLFGGKTYEEPSDSLRLRTAKKHLGLLVADKGKDKALFEARKHIAWHIKGIPGAPALRNAVNRCTCLTDLENMLDDAIRRTETT